MMYKVCGVLDLLRVPSTPSNFGRFVDFASPLTPVANGLEAGESYFILHWESALKSLMELPWLSTWQDSLLFRLCN